MCIRLLTGFLVSVLIIFLASSFLYSYWEGKEGFKSTQRLWNTVKKQQVSTEILFALSNVLDLRWLFAFCNPEEMSAWESLRSFAVSWFADFLSLLIIYFFRQKSLPRAKLKVNIVKLLSRSSFSIFVTGNRRLEVRIMKIPNKLFSGNLKRVRTRILIAICGSYLNS